MRYTLFIIILVLVSTASLFAQKAVRKNIREGNDHYAQDQYLESELSYRKALEVNGTDSLATFNLGNSLYRQQKAEDALRQYQTVAEQASSSGNKPLAAQAYYNMGDIMMSSQQYDKAVQCFKQSLRNNPLDNEARYNLILAQRLLQKQQQDQQNQDQNQQQQQDQQQDQQQQDQQQQQQEQQNQDQQQDQQQQQEQEQQQRAGQMSQEKAEQILQAAEQDERDTQEKVQEAQMRKVRQRRVDKDW